MKIKDFLKKMNFDSDAIVEVCDVNLSLDNRTRLTRHQLICSKDNPFAGMSLQSFSVINCRLVIYAV